MITGIEHIALLSPDTARLRDWYMDLFGFRVVYDNGKGTYFLAAADGSMLELITQKEAGEATGTHVGGIRHIAFSVDDFEDMVTKLMDAGVEVVTPAAVNDKGVGTFFFRDIDGNILHLISRPKPLV